MEEINIVADRDIPWLQGVPEPYADVTYLKGAAITAADVAGADALVVRTRTCCDRALLEGSRVRLIATATIGYDHIDLDYCRAHGIEVATSAGCNARGVLQWFGAAMEWLHRHRRIAAPERTTIGVVGVGHVGSLVAQYAADWGFRVLCCDPPRQRGEDDGTLYRPDRFYPLDEIARQADVVTFHVPLTCEGPDATPGMASAEFLRRLKPGAVVLNSSRGEVAASTALLAAVESGHCQCVIDTWAGEPHPDPRLLDAALLATPHIAGYTVQGKAMGTAMAVRTLARRFGWPLTEWYPEGESLRSRPSAIAWDEMCARMPRYFDIEALSRTLKTSPGRFEALRNHYDYRQEFF